MISKHGTLGVVAVGVLLASVSLAAAGTKTTSTWSAADLGTRTLTKVIVMARVSEEASRRLLEDAVSKALRDNGIDAITAYQNLAPQDLASREAIEAKARSLGADAGLAYTVTGEKTDVKGGSHVSVSVGVPVHAGPFGAFLGTSVPLGGGPKTVRRAGLKAELHLTSVEGPQWIATYEVEPGKDNVRLADDLAKLAVKQLKKAGAIR